LALIFSPPQVSNPVSLIVANFLRRVEVDAGELALARGEPENLALRIEVDEAGTLAAILAGQLRLDDALAAGVVKIEGSKKEARRILRLFPMPEPQLV
jgi:hypothetical protein